MDRFIVTGIEYSTDFINNLKSNMDRFIDNNNHWHALCEPYLKSNMDRFIVCSVSVASLHKVFKIQYG